MLCWVLPMSPHNSVTHTFVPLITRVFLSPIVNTITILAQYTAGGHSNVIIIFCFGAALTLILNMRYKLDSVYGILTADSRGSLADAGHCTGTPVSLIGTRRGGDWVGVRWWRVGGRGHWHLVIATINKQRTGMEKTWMIEVDNKNSFHSEVWIFP